MKLTAKVILATFNTSKSGKSLIRIEGDTMIIVNATVADMCRKGEIDEVTFTDGQPLMDQADPNKVVFNTKNVSDFKESAIARLQQANALCLAYDGVDEEKVSKAIALAGQIKF